LSFRQTRIVIGAPGHHRDFDATCRALDSGLLNTSCNKSMIAPGAISTGSRGWNNFAIDFSDFARHGRGLPLFKPAHEVPADYPAQIFDSRFSDFRNIRRQFDPENRMINPFLSPYFP